MSLLRRLFLFSCRMEAYGGGIDTEALPCRFRPVIEHVSQMCIASRTGHFSPHHIWVCDQQQQIATDYASFFMRCDFCSLVFFFFFSGESEVVQQRSGKGGQRKEQQSVTIRHIDRHPLSCDTLYMTFLDNRSTLQS